MSVNIDKVNKINEQMLDFYKSNPKGEKNRFNLDTSKNCLKEIFLNLKYDKSVLVYGDYDTDGIISSSLMYIYLKKIKEKLGNKANIDLVFSDRKSFFGLNKELYDEYSKKYDLIIMTDNGSEEKFLNKDINNLLIFDHHPTNNNYKYIFNPNINTNKYSTSGGKVVFDFLVILDKNLKSKLDISLFENKDLFNIFKELTAITLISDMANLNEYNRNFIKEAFETMKEKKLAVFHQLNEFNTTSIGFNISPKINAVSRMEGDLKNVFKWLFPKDYEEFKFAEKYIKKIDNEKKDIILKFYNSISKDVFNKNIVFINVEDKRLKSGLNGLLANKILGEFNKPAIVFSKEGEYYTGSARGKDIKTFFNMLKEKNSDFFNSGEYGGHLDAMGFRTKNIKDLDFIEKNIELYQNKSAYPVLSDEVLNIDEYALLKKEYNKIAKNVDFHNKTSVFIENDVSKLNKISYKNYTLYSNENIKFLIPNTKTKEFEESSYLLIELRAGNIENVKFFLDDINDINYKICVNEDNNILINEDEKEEIKKNKKTDIKNGKIIRK